MTGRKAGDFNRGQAASDCSGLAGGHAAQAAASVEHSLPMTLQATSRPRMKRGSLNPGRQVSEDRSSETTRRAATSMPRQPPTVKSAEVSIGI